MDSENEVALEEFINANNSFAVVAYKEVLRHNEGNFLVSPLSAEIVLAFAQSGCKNGTAQEIRSALCLPDDGDKLEVGITNFMPFLKSGENYALHNANKLYIKENFKIKEEFKKVALEIYQADVENIDFERKQEAAGTMNNWVEEKTNNKIKNLFDPDNFDELTRAVIANALYFKADWHYTFTGADTRSEDFYVTAKEALKVDMMHYRAFYNNYFNYSTNKELDAQFLELPFQGKEASMVIVLPNQKEGLASLENEIDKVFIPCQFRKTRVNIGLPKFKIDGKIDFKKILWDLGVRKAFDAFEADLSGIAGNKGDLIISAVVQKTFIDVNEEGVEAAAASFCCIPVPCCGSNEQPPSFIADHPFIFYIKIKDVIVFAGKVTKPVQ